MEPLPSARPRARKGHPVTTPSNVAVERADDRNRYEILVDGALAGFTEYRDHDAQRVFFHTEVDEAFAGQGLASRLVREALTDVRATGRRIVPICPYVAEFLLKHEEFGDITDPVTPEVKGWLRTQLY
ncbi:GNAT family N-acetyltransferase [Kitasatospora sp. NPDC056651]|uniref:GNAT family N-acetyltransferase n=1 Tax=Kitasatospora sp. NPDC056651 TaxID=3345892 RepID=UPI003681D70F